MTEQEAIKEFEERLAIADYRDNIPKYYEAMELAVKDMKEVQQYRTIGTVEELLKAVKEEDILKFYYCDSEDSYLVGLRIDNFYYAHYIDGRWVFDMSRHLPWGKHVVDDATAWKEYTYPSEPKEIDFSSWLQGFIKKECGATIEECRSAVEKQKAKKVKIEQWIYTKCDCGYEFSKHHGDGYYSIPYERKTKYCPDCGQKLDFGE